MQIRIWWKKFNGRLVRKANGEYGLKVNIYGYDDRMLKELNDYLLEGRNRSGENAEEDTAIMATLDGRTGKLRMESVCPRRCASVRTPKTASDRITEISGEDSDWNLDLQVQGSCQQNTGKSGSGFYGMEQPALLAQNEQMQKYFGIEGYRPSALH